MIDKINKVLTEAEGFRAENLDDLENFRIKYLSKKGIVSFLFDEFRKVPSEEKREIGKSLNILKNKLAEIIEEERVRLTKDQKQEVDFQDRPG